MDLMGTFSRMVYQPLLYRRRGLDVGSWERHFAKVEEMTADALSAHRENRIVQMLCYAHKYVPYYRQLLQEICDGNPERLCAAHLFRLPILTKDLVRAENSRLLSADKTLRDVCRNMTGGSTGTPLVFYQDGDYRAAALGAERRILKWLGISAGDRTTAFWGADRELKEQTPRERLMTWLERVNTFDSFSMSEQKMHEFAALLMRWKPVYIKGYASSLHLFSRFLLENRECSIRPVAIRSTAETLFEFQRADIERAFGCKVFNFYGSREINNLAAECKMQNGLHILEGARVVEVVDVKGAPVAAGEVGRIVVTDLVNRAMPFLRYENGDLGAVSEAACPCGLPYRRIEKILGRVSDILVGLDGQYVHGEFVTHLFYGNPCVKSFQVVQHDLHNIEILVQATDAAPPDLTQVKERIRARLGDVAITTTFTDGFSRNSSGKHRFVVSKVSPFG